MVNIKNLKKILKELSISKVKLSRYLGVSRQMVYNYLKLDNVNELPKEKRLMISKLLNVPDLDQSSLQSININAEYLENIETILNQYDSKGRKSNNIFDFDTSNLSKAELNLLNDIIGIIKEKFADTTDKNKNYYTFLYLLHVLQSIDNIPEIKYLFCYLSKKTGFTNPNEYQFNETSQYILESIIYTAFNLYNSGGASKSRLRDSHERFIREIEMQKEEQLSRTQQLNSVRLQALKELGYTEINKLNASEVFDKIVEIQSRTV